MNIPYYHVDAFTSAPFHGNPAGVCLLEAWPDDDLLQSIAAEHNLSETAFLVPAGGGGAGDLAYELRWMTPTIEVDLCGHATLASAFVVLNLVGPDGAEEIRFETKESGMLVVRRDGSRLAMDFPAMPAAPCPAPGDLVAGLGATPNEVLLARDLMAVFDTEDQVRELEADMTSLTRLDEALGVIATAPGATTEVDFVSRYFAPRAGVPEDPVTGSAHCTLVPYWAQRLGKPALHARQISCRVGDLYCTDRGARVTIAGDAVLYARGTISVDAAG